MNNILRKALAHYGITHQTLILCEECSELSKAATKILRLGPSPDTRSSLMEEIADVMVCMKQMELYYGLDWTEINRIYTEKVERLAQRMEATE